MTDSSSMATLSAGGESTQPSEPTVRPKKKRSLPGMPDPDAEVIALSPKSLMETNRYVCDICGKGFQRDQNLQLHRRGHNLPWKLKQRPTGTEVKKRVYVCPEPSCAHHDPSRALGDLTGIKKHFCRKHGEKKYRCERCNKSYAVQCDWKAHMKICGTREYPCDCGTVFSRRDSFITHRAFCDALAQESARSQGVLKVQAMTAAVNPKMPSSSSPPPQPPTPSTGVLSPALSIQSSELPENQSGHSQQKKETPPISSDTTTNSVNKVRARGGSSTSCGNNNWNSEVLAGVFALSGHSQQQKETPIVSAATTSTIKERAKGPSSTLNLDVGNNSDDFARVFGLVVHSGQKKETTPTTAAVTTIKASTRNSSSTPSGKVNSNVDAFALPEHSLQKMESSSVPAETTTLTVTDTGSSPCNGNSNSEAFAGVFALSMPAIHSESPASYPDLFCVPTGSARTILEPMSLSLSTPLYPSSNSASLFLSTSYDNHQQCTSSPQPTLSATALLQKATQIGSKSSCSSFLQGLGLAMSSASDHRDDITASPTQWDCLANPENKSITSSGLGLGLQSDSSSTFLHSMMEPSPAMIFSNKPPTLDFLGVGLGANQASSNEYPALLSSMNGRNHFGIASSSFGGILGGNSWVDPSDQKPGFL